MCSTRPAKKLDRPLTAATMAPPGRAIPTEYRKGLPRTPAECHVEPRTKSQNGMTF